MDKLSFIVVGTPLTNSNSNPKPWREKIEAKYREKYHSQLDPKNIKFKITLKFFLKNDKDLDNLPKYVLDTLFSCNDNDSKAKIKCPNSCFSNITASS